MRLLQQIQQIQESAVDSQVHLPDLLRRCKLLGAKLGSGDFKRWVDHELNGYPPDASVVPEYRVLHVHSFGYFVGPLGVQYKNAPIPSVAIPEKYRELVTVHRMIEPISSLADLLQRGAEDDLQASWSADLIAVVGRKIYESMSLFSAYQAIPRGSIVAIVDQVRTRILSFAIEIESALPDLADAGHPSEASAGAKQATERVERIFNSTIVMGNVGNFATGSSDFSQSSQYLVNQGDLESLKAFLRRTEIPAEDISALEQSLSEDSSATPEKPRLGPKVSSWIARMIEKGSQGALRISASVAGDVLTKAVTKYLGLD